MSDNTFSSCLKRTVKPSLHRITAVWHDKEANVTFLFGDAMKLAIEAIQVAAMCKKFLEMEGKR